jgi:hypothetical protein
MIDRQIKRKVCNLILAFAVGVGFFIVSYGFVVDFYLVSSGYLHEGGHHIGSILSDISSRRPIEIPHVNNTEFSPNFHIKYPQQTTVRDENMTSILTMLGGMFFGAIILTIICFFILRFYHFNPTKMWIIIFPLVYLIVEVNSNFICGYDNLAHAPFTECNTNVVNHFIWENGSKLSVIGLGLLLSYFVAKIVYDRLNKNSVC